MYKGLGEMLVRQAVLHMIEYYRLQHGQKISATFSNPDVKPEKHGEHFPNPQRTVRDFVEVGGCGPFLGYPKQ